MPNQESIGHAVFLQMGKIPSYQFFLDDFCPPEPIGLQLRAVIV